LISRAEPHLRDRRDRFDTPGPVSSLERLHDLSPDAPGRLREMPFEVVKRQSA
jgi:hypothetical protein